MGGDLGPTEIVPAALCVLSGHPQLRLLLVGQREVLGPLLEQHGAGEDDRLRIVHASQVVSMQELPSVALRTKKDSSMRIAIELVRERKADACVSAGNTGALVATARYVLKTLPGIDRPAICGTLPALAGHTHFLDLGANVDCTSEQLFQFAVMGSELASAADNKSHPTVALLNIGVEEIKGNDRVKQAAALLAESHLNYVGFVEGNDLYTGKADVVVCDGFVGNVALKASEGVAELINERTRREFMRTLYGRFAALMARPVLKAVLHEFDPRRHNGASLLGLRGIVIKSHGRADRVSFAYAIEEAILEIEQNIPERISHRLEALLSERHTN
jgi:glycerol-3-phosphate acyltransferase PlsX